MRNRYQFISLPGSPLSSCVFSWFKQADWPSCELTLVVTCVRSPGKYRLGKTPWTYKVKTLGMLANDYSKLLAQKVIPVFPYLNKKPQPTFWSTEMQFYWQELKSIAYTQKWASFRVSFQWAQAQICQLKSHEAAEHIMNVGTWLCQVCAYVSQWVRACGLKGGWKATFMSVFFCVGFKKYT